MKKLKKLLSIVLAVAMVMSLAVSVTASNYTISITPASGATVDGSEVYYAYKIFDAEASGSTYIYTISSNDSTAYFLNTIKSLSNVYDYTGAEVSTVATAYFKLTATDSTNTTYIVETTNNTRYTDGEGNYILADAVVSTLKALVDTDSNYANAVAHSTYNSGSFDIELSDAGYYYITTTVGSAVEIGTHSAVKTVNDKNTTPTVDKTVSDTGDANSYGETNNVQIDDKVYFQTKISNIDDATNLELHDLMDAGLDFIEITSVTLYSYSNPNGTPLTANGTDYTVDTDSSNYYLIDTSNTDKYTFKTDGTYYTKDVSVYSPVTDEILTDFDSNTDYYVKSTFDIEFVLGSTNLSNLDSTSYIIVCYTAKVTPAAVIYSDENENETYVSYGESSYSAKDLTKTYTYKVTVYKYDGTTDQPLGGAKFNIYYGDSTSPTYLKASYNSSTQEWAVTGTTNDQTEATEFVSGDTTGNIVINGLDSETTYYLVETEAPASYNPLTSPIQFKINDTDLTKVDYGTSAITENKKKDNISVKNSQGKEMPETGGIGVTIFYVVGGILVLAAAGVIVISKKRRTEK